MDFNDNITLVNSLKTGDEKAFMFLYNKYYRRLYAYALALIDDKAAAQDIIQEVFLNTWKYRKRLDSQYTIQSFLYKTVHNEFITQYQKNKKEMTLQLKYVQALNAVMDDNDPTSIERLISLVNKEIQNLPPKCKNVFLLSKKEGLTNIEISDHLNVTIKTVEAQITKAYSVLRKKLGNKVSHIIFLLFDANRKKIVLN